MTTAKNPVALRAVRAILEAATRLELDVAGTRVVVEPTRGPTPVWPRPIEGLDPARDGPWPTPVLLPCSWEGGRTRLRLELGSWRSSGGMSDYVGISAVEDVTGQQLVWITVTNALGPEPVPEVVSVYGQFGIQERKADAATEGIQRLSKRLKELVRASGLPCPTPASMEAFQLRTRDGAVLPSAGEAYRRIVHLALLKLPFMTRNRPGAIEGAAFLSLPPQGVATDLNSAEPLPPEATTPAEGGKRWGIWPLPGGVRQYKETLDNLLAWIAEQPRTSADFAAHLLERYEVKGPAALTGYRRLLTATGWATEEGGDLKITAEGAAYLQQDRFALAVFAVLHQRFHGVLATLVIADTFGAATMDRTLRTLNYLLGTDWRSQNQAAFRRNWLLSLALTERTAEGDRITDFGRRALEEHREEADEIRARILAAPEEVIAPAPAADEDALDADDVPETEGGTVAESRAPAAPGGAPGWEEHRLDLVASRVAPHAAGLVLPAAFLEQASAALSAGKHLLLVGPPGTGKTRVAEALCAAATAEGYCSSPLVATASADWSTFETIGGYALKKDQSLCFRPGVLLRALAERRWLVIDELNRADVDRAFGELMTVLSGVGSETPFVDDEGRPVSVGPEPGRSHRVTNTFRVIATMNTWDKTSLFRLSYAAQRRFAILHLGPPEPARYQALLRDAATREGLDPPLEAAAADALATLFSPRELLAFRAIGPAVPLDMIRYLRRRQASGDGLAEAVTLYLLAQLEGLPDEGARQALHALLKALRGWASDTALAEVRARFQELFLHVSFPTE